ncbi:acyltransferase [Kineobactrum sediminis]|uniref:Acyltransferase n=1 Tax=Kineobactrum sediminis TaxID=1905677 RepID=A0A2N5Y4A4_9GAMM|nr:lysophospholipid acyltransferase family protein [Kineobactrum sediminis]PLW83221.1 acyltransferase [Kineobactrum sediminis]
MTLMDKDNQPLQGERLEAHIEQALAVTLPHTTEARLTWELMRRLFRPMVQGAERLPPEPCLFVGNHSLFALDGLVMAAMMQQVYGRFLRPMGDKFLFTHRSLEKALVSRGAVMGHPAVCHALMEHGQDLLVFPGGAHEAVKPSRLRYQLQWKERFGFIKMAAEHGYTIMPFGMVGPDEFYSHLIESEDIPDSLPGKVLRRLGLLTDDTRTDVLPPIPVGALGTLLPKPQRCYIGFGEPVRLARYKERKPTRAQLRRIRDQVAHEIDQQLAELLLLREQNRRKDSLLRRILTL